ncbi:MAG TPA: SET domain-containing protein-lysine N-methyltransferase [Gemmatimonadaceae bacterium]|jgi:hypothetical protein|nr:SET domain-containing protein-lysine N-methyltransferase [Gemmatimonadaceae bacterium]
MPTQTRTKKRATKPGQKPAKRSTKKSAARSEQKARPSRAGRAGPVNEWLELRRSGIHGLGGFARKKIPKGTRIIEYQGEKIANAEADRRYEDERMKEHHTFLFILNSRQCVDAAFDGNEARFINHSCDPNCEVEISRGRIWIQAAKSIAAGTELVYDYDYDDDPEYTEENLRFYGCICGSPNCRGTIVNTKRLMNKRPTQ